VKPLGPGLTSSKRKSSSRPFGVPRSDLLQTGPAGHGEFSLSGDSGPFGVPRRGPHRHSAPPCAALGHHAPPWDSQGQGFPYSEGE
jgi:hypothetical protein